MITAPRLTVDVAEALRAGHDALIELGGAKRGDKTMLDALGPFVECRRIRGATAEPTGAVPGWPSVEVAQKAAAELPPTCAPRSAGPDHWPSAASGTPDAGAISLAMCIGHVGRS